MSATSTSYLQARSDARVNRAKLLEAAKLTGSKRRGMMRAKPKDIVRTGQ